MIRVPSNTADQSVSQPSDTQRMCIRTCLGICRTSHRPDECGTRPCFRLVQAQGHNPDTPGKHKNALGPVDIPLKKGAPRAPGNKPSPFDEG